MRGRIKQTKSEIIMKKVYTILALFFAFVSYTAKSQTYLMSNVPVSTCSGTFYDSGNSGGQYGNNENFTKTFTSNVVGNTLSFNFTAFRTNTGEDTLYAYDGPTTASPLIGVYTGNLGGFGTITSTGTSITFKFKSDGAGTRIGWAATITCNPPIPACALGTGVTNIAALPFNVAGATTCGNVNDVTSANVTNVCGSTSYYGGEDNVYVFVPTQTGQITITLTSSETWTGLMLYNGCPISGGVCVANAQSSTANKTLTACVTAGQAYFLVLDTYPSPTCIVTFSLGITAVTPCSGTPAGGSASASPASITCPAQTVTLSTTGGSAGCFAYQWQSSVDNVNWVNMAGATTATYAYAPTASLYYRLVTSCPSAGTSANSSSVLVPVSGTLPANDEPCNATVLTVNAGACAYNTSTNNCASASPSIYAPGCSSYSGGDVWFQVTVPASGRLIVDLGDAGGPTDMGMAWYTGACGSLNAVGNLVECDDDDSQNGAMPMICRTGVLCTVPGDCAQNATLAAGTTVWIRVWEYGNDVFGPFNICAYEPNPPGVASTCANATNIPSLPYSAAGLTTCCRGNEYDATDGCASTYQDGEDYLFSYTPTVNQNVDITLSGTGSYTGVFITDRCPGNGGAVCVAQATNSAGNPSLCGASLVAGTTYYIMVDTDPTPNCTNFNISMMTSTTPTCGLNYSISSIANSPDPNAGTIINLPVDDQFAPAYTPIGFNFCFDGIQYTQLIVSSNGYVIFDPLGCATNLPTTNAAPNGYSPYSISAAVPNTTNAPRNAIMFPWQDIDPNDGGTLRYQVLGVAPNRRFVLTYNSVAMFGTSCTSYLYTGQLKLFETTNNIEMHITRKDMCSAWISGQAILGLHNYNGTIARVPAGYNAPTQWTATNQAWRFTCNCATCTALPVELILFEGEKISENVNELTWSTATETNNAYFEVQRMESNGTFTLLDKVNGAGNSNSIINYRFLDNDAPAGSTYYRLKQVDKDGQYNYSATIVVGDIPELAEVISTYPSPANDHLTIKLNSDGTNMRIALIAINGQEYLLTENLSVLGYDELTFNVSDIPPGIYLIRINSDKNEVYYKDKIVIQR